MTAREFDDVEKGRWSPSRFACQGWAVALPAVRVDGRRAQQERRVKQAGGRVDKVLHPQEAFDHIGIPTTEPQPGESWVAFSEVWVTNPRVAKNALGTLGVMIIGTSRRHAYLHARMSQGDCWDPMKPARFVFAVAT